MLGSMVNIRQGDEMGRKRVPKGQIIIKKNEKIAATILALPTAATDEELVRKFKEMYPKEWSNVIRRYNAHESLTPPGKSHPMAHPEKYMLTAIRQFRKKRLSEEELHELVEKLKKPKRSQLEDIPVAPIVRIDEPA